MNKRSFKMANATSKPKSATIVKKVATSKENSSNVDENARLKEQLAEMQAKINSMSSVLNAFQNMTTQQPQNSKEKEVVFISLFYGILNLYTEASCHGVHYRFQEYGDEKRIPWSQAKGIVTHQEEFAKNGLFYIKDVEFVNEFPVLKDSYEKMVDKTTLESLFALKKASFRASFEALPQSQKELFADLVLRKSQANEEIDYNIIKIAGDVLGRKLLQEISEAETAFSNE
jgi:hypothetical protein